MAEDKLRTFTGWKLDLMRAVRADHKVSPAAAALFDAFMDFVNEETRRAWPSEAGLALALGVSRLTVRKYLRILIDAQWLKAVGRSDRGTTIYEVQDFRMRAVLDQLAIEIDRHREREAHRKALRRQKSMNVRIHGLTPTPAVSVHTGFHLSGNPCLHEHLHRTPSKVISEQEETLNPYAIAKGRIA